MCITRFKIKRVGTFPRFGKDFVFAPCGKCADCRRHTQYAWAWRLTSDVQHFVKNEGYRVGFITLTYNDSHLPRFPQYFSDGSESPLYGEPCFSKEDTEKLILYIRKVTNRDRGMRNFLYFLASEYGPVTRRPHYHMLIAWPAKSVKYKYKRGSHGTVVESRQEFDNDAQYIHGIIKHYWCEYLCNGFVSPNHVLGGGSKRSGKAYLPFEIKTLSDCMNSAFYCAKYVTKDIYYLQELWEKFPMDDERWKDDAIRLYLPHHRQTKSLGFQSVASLSDAEKIALLNRGRVLLGSDKLSLPPMYVKNKLLFKPCYFIDSSGKRLVLQECTEFFKKNFRSVMSVKESYFDTLFDSWKDEQYWISSGLSPEDAKTASWHVRMNDSHDLFGCSLAQAYIYYYGIPYKMAYRSFELCYKNRYLSYPAHLMNVNFERIDENHYKNIQEFFNYMMVFVSWKTESDDDYQTDYTRDYNNQPLQQTG